eukprot:4300668-Prymnesium_polylepis.1
MKQSCKLRAPGPRLLSKAVSSIVSLNSHATPGACSCTGPLRTLALQQCHWHCQSRSSRTHGWP